jgi:hypothetical protein
MRGRGGGLVDEAKVQERVDVNAGGGDDDDADDDDDALGEAQPLRPRT